MLDADELTEFTAELIAHTDDAHKGGYITPCDGFVWRDGVTATCAECRLLAQEARP